jgi:hypothetical protein
MKDKYANFFSYIADLYNMYVLDTNEDDSTSSAIRNYASSEEDYKKVHFGYLALLCNGDHKSTIEKTRNIHKDQNNVEECLQNIKRTTESIKKVIEKIDSIPENEIKETIIKLSRYVDLFTGMYFK